MDDELISLAWLDMLAALGVAIFISLLLLPLLAMMRGGSAWRERRRRFGDRRRR